MKNKIITIVVACGALFAILLMASPSETSAQNAGEERYTGTHVTGTNLMGPEPMTEEFGAQVGAAQNRKEWAEEQNSFVEPVVEPEGYVVRPGAMDRVQVVEVIAEPVMVARVKEYVAPHKKVVVHSQNRVVTLSGSVPTASEKAALVDYVSRMEGVSRVQDNLRVQP